MKTQIFAYWCGTCDCEREAEYHNTEECAVCNEKVEVYQKVAEK